MINHTACSVRRADGFGGGGRGGVGASGQLDGRLGAVIEVWCQFERKVFTQKYNHADLHSG